ncbi:NEL-type E3 ubiquitin ligase domain-containing protein [Pseudomonas sp.]|uniref:NEL-type E3 ubiquitin ligase domain-containing protein n=1 Tax=Pseudomonas sp. TaxID=306 RepID=UPI0028B24978|nr:NEL-type E3 ubiquitin ligase domain-containing protein [Pseudomonas sp.]
MVATTPSTSQEAALYQDHWLSEALPQWLRTARAAQLQALHEASGLSLYWRERCEQVLDQVQGIEAFCRTRLRQALRTHMPEVDEATVRWRYGQREPVVTSQPIGSPVSRAVYRTQPLLEAALANFTVDQAEPDGMLVGNRLEAPPGSEAPLPNAATFVRFCRTLDLGGHYQQHLQAVLEAAPEHGPAPRTVFARHLRYALLVEAHRARIEGHLDEQAHRLLVDVCGLRLPGQGGATLQIGRLRLLGYTLERIVVLDGSQAPFYGSPEQAVLAYIPGDPHGALRGYASLRHLANDLGRRLRTADYQRFFARFVRRRDSQGFFEAVDGGYAGVGDLGNIDLEERLLACAAPVFDALAHAQIEQIRDDARLIATPVAEIDARVQREHDQRLAAEGWTLLNLAGLFVPAVGAALLAVTAWEILDETFHGIAAWRQGEHGEALDHLFNVATQVASLVLVGAGSVAVAEVWQRSQVVDGLLPLTLQDGRVRLGRPRLDTLRSALPARAVRDELGLYRLGERHWVELDGQHYPVGRTDAQEWVLRTADGVVHPLCHNGAGAWRLWYESPLHWTASRALFRRLSLTPIALDDEAIDLILEATDSDAGTLRALHLHGSAGDTLLQDSTERVVLDARIRALIRQLRAGEPVRDAELLAQARALPEAVELSDQALAEHLWQHRRGFFALVDEASQTGASAHAQVLLRDFPGLGRRAAEALAAAGSVAERERLVGQGRVPPAMALAARRSLRRQQVARAYQGLSIDMPQGPELARLALSLCLRLPGTSQRLAWRVFAHARDGLPLWVSEHGLGARQLDLVHTPAGFQLFDAQGDPLSTAPDELFATLATGYDAAERASLGVAEPFAHNLRVLVARQARVDRQALPGLLGQRAPEGWFQIPTRLADGRLGYRLSGRGQGQAPRSLGAQLRWLYPLIGDAEAEEWAQQVRDSGAQVSQIIRRLNREMRLLESHLQLWVRGAAGIVMRNERSRFGDQLLSAWRRMTPRIFRSNQPLPGYQMRWHGSHLPSLPSLPAGVSFAHIDTLSLRDLGLTEVGPEFLDHFPNLRVLELNDNALRRLPHDLERLVQLRELSLEGNAIALEADQAGSLRGLAQLRTLNLAGNPLRQGLSLEGLTQLRYLSLRNTELSAVPPGLLRCPQLRVADLRNNRIATLPESFFRAPPWLVDAVHLAHNRLDDATMARLAARVAGAVDEPLPSGATRDVWLALVPPEAQAERAIWWDEVHAQAGAEGLFDLLRRLQRSADFARPGAALGQRVWTLIEALHGHADLAEEIFALANLPLTCQDSAALSFSALELHLLVWRALREARSVAGSQEGALLHLGRQLWRLDEVERIAVRDIETRRADGANPDQIEVVLAYRVGLRQALDLPAQPQDMLFAAVSGVDQTRLDAARQAVLAAERPEVLAPSLVQREFWRTWLERHHAERLDAMDEPYQARLASLMADAEAGTSEGDYLRQMNAVRDEREAARTALLVTLTRQILAAQPH